MRHDVLRGTTLALLISSLCANGTLASAQQLETPKYQSAFARPLTIDRGSAALSQSLQKLHTRASLSWSSLTRMMKTEACSPTRAAIRAPTHRCSRSIAGKAARTTCPTTTGMSSERCARRSCWRPVTIMVSTNIGPGLPTSASRKRWKRRSRSGVTIGCSTM